MKKCSWYHLQERNTGRLLSETGEKSIWFDKPREIATKIKTNLCDECWQTNCVVDMCDFGADKSYEVLQNRLIFTV